MQRRDRRGATIGDTVTSARPSPCRARGRARARSYVVAALLLGACAVAPQAGAGTGGPILHEPISEDAREDVALAVSLDGELPAAIQTRSGLVTAPDPTKPEDAKRAPYAPSHGGPGATPDATFSPDRDTRKPDTLPYDEPFRPSTAPFKRLSAYDAVDDNFVLFVRNPRTVAVPLRSGPVVEATEEAFYADLVIDLVPGRRSRIPTVGPGTRVVKARAGVGTEDVPVRIWRDGAENWFVEGDTMSRARLVMQLAAPRAAFGGTFGEPTWDQLPRVPSLPPRVARAHEVVIKALGLGRGLTPHENVNRMVAYFRSFADSAESPPPVHDIYTDLALSKKGVCRHRAFAFLITALGLGIPARMIANEAHAWVEVHDGQRFMRIDLGGAGNMLRDPLSTNVPFEPPPDPFSWPLGATRGEDLGNKAREATAAGQSGPGGAEHGGKRAASASSGGPPDLPPSGSAGSVPRANASAEEPGMSKERLDDARPGASVELRFKAASVARGGRLEASGEVRADGEPCARVPVELVVRDAGGRGPGGHETSIGTLATDAQGRYEGGLVLPRGLPLGAYEIFARTAGDARCGKGISR